jgi:hypothetical protein
VAAARPARAGLGDAGSGGVLTAASVATLLLAWRRRRDD